MPKHRPSLPRDAAIVFLSLLIAALIVRSGVVHDILAATDNLGVITSFIAGGFFASVFTAAPAGVVLGELAQELPPLTVALFGGLGCFLSDLVIANFLRRRVTDDVDDALRHSPFRKFYKKVRKNPLLRCLTAILGAILIMSPLPDEIGLLLMGATKMPRRIFYPLLFALDFTGIYIIAILARTLQF